MQMRPCKYCQNPVRPLTDRCPACGNNSPWPTTVGDVVQKIIGGGFILGSLGFLLYSCVDSTSRRTAKKEADEKAAVDRLRRDVLPSGPSTGSPAKATTDFSPYNISIGDGIMVINRELGRAPSFTIPLENGYLGKPALDAYYDTPEGCFRFLYYVGRSVDGSKISREEFDRWKRESLLY